MKNDLQKRILERLKTDPLVGSRGPQSVYISGDVTDKVKALFPGQPLGKIIENALIEIIEGSKK